MNLRWFFVCYFMVLFFLRFIWVDQEERIHKHGIRKDTGEPYSVLTRFGKRLKFVNVLIIVLPPIIVVGGLL